MDRLAADQKKLTLDVSIVIPTFNEKQNVVLLTQRLVAVLKQMPISYEIWFIDDSHDETPQILAKLVADHACVRYLHRTDARGLGSAVVEGFQRARGRYLIVMDGDLQHPPEVLPKLFVELAQGADLVIPSRFIPGGSGGGLNYFRRLISWMARCLGRLLIKKLGAVSDCTGGFFGVRREVIEGVVLNPISWKILIEIIVKGNAKTIREVPYHFMARDAGASKMGWREQWCYLRHVFQLAKYR